MAINVHVLCGDSVRIIAVEPGIPLLASISCIGTIRESNDDRTLVEVYSGNPNKLHGFEILLLRTDVDLTRRELEVHGLLTEEEEFSYNLSTLYGSSRDQLSLFRR